MAEAPPRPAAAGNLGPRLAGRLTADLISRSPQYMSCIKLYEIDLRGALALVYVHRVAPCCSSLYVSAALLLLMTLRAALMQETRLVRLKILA